LHHSVNCIMFNRVKGFSKVQFQYYKVSLGMLALINVFKGSPQTVLNRPCFNEAILIKMDQRDDIILQLVCHKLCDDLDDAIC
jgi:hypothetical protein